MKTTKLWALLFLMLVLAGCGGGGSLGKGGAAPTSPARTSSGFDAAPGQSSDSSSPAPSAPPAAAARGGTASGVAPAPRAEAKAEARERATADDADVSAQSRPGLGTEWGETRTSRVHDVSFVRDSSQPFALATLHYNDRRGVEALATLHARRTLEGRALTTGGGAVSVSIRDENGAPLEAMHVGDRTLVVGQQGQRYSIVLTNNTGHRFEAVTTVDGLDVVNGKPGNLSNRGYVLMPFATVEIDGFRQSTNHVAAFRFASVADSYAAQTGSARNVGVIGVALFGERGDAFVPENETRLRDTASPFPADGRFAQPPRR
jgi:hypothetical protein